MFGRIASGYFFFKSLTLLLLACQYSSAQVLEEVIVTSQIREEGLQDVSVSVSALSGDLLAKQNLARIEDIVAYIPNFSYSETGIGTTVYIRGIGSGINQGFEQSVGMYSDGIYYGRAQLTRSPMFDLERVEVLRGPQITLFGNNSVGGAISLITRKPGSEPEASISLLAEPEHGEYEVTTILSGALTDSLNGRLSLRGYQMEGYLHNKTRDRDEPQRDYNTARLGLNFYNGGIFDANLKLERSIYDTNGRQIRVFESKPSVGYGASGTNYASAVGGLAGWDLNQILSAFPSVGGATVADPSDDGARFSNGDYSDNETNNVTLQMSWQFDNGYSVNSIIGYLDYDYEEWCDCDFTGAQLVPLVSAEEYDQQSLEIRLVSPVGQPLEFISGIYYQQDDLEFNDALLTLAAPSGFNDLLVGVLGAGPAALASGKSVPRQFAQDSKNKAVFAEVTWNIQDSLRLILGARHSETEKHASRELTFTDFDGAPLPPATLANLDIIYNVLFKAYRHDLEGDRDEQHTGFNITGEWDITDDMLVYTSYKKGFKPGGFDVRSNSVPDISQALGPLFTFQPGAFEFEDEQIIAYELGTKLRIGGEAEINIAYYYTEMKDLQVSVFDGALGFNVNNAAEAVSEGIEIDGRWSLDEHWMLSGSIGFMDFEFQDYPDGLCTSAQQLQAAISGVGANGQPVSQGTECVRDFSGLTNQYVADYSGSVSLDYQTTLADRWLFNGGLTVLFSDEYSPAQNLDPVVQQDAYQKVNMRLAVGDIDGVWEVALLAKNIFDEEIITYANDVPLSTSQFGSSTYYGFVERPRSVALQFRYQFL